MVHTLAGWTRAVPHGSGLRGHHYPVFPSIHCCKCLGAVQLWPLGGRCCCRGLPYSTCCPFSTTTHAIGLIGMLRLFFGATAGSMAHLFNHLGHCQHACAQLQP